MKNYFKFFLLLSIFLMSSCSSEEEHHHHLVTESGIPATCTEDGTTDKIYCDVCGEVLFPHETIPATGHHVVKVPALAAGIQYEGHNEYEYCDVCDTFLTECIKENKLLVKDEIYSHTHDNSVDFKLKIHKDNISYHVDIVVKHDEDEERFELDNNNEFTYSGMQNDTLYEFTFDTKYSDGDAENLTKLTRYINTASPELASIKIETKEYEWPSSRKVSAPPGCMGFSQTDNNYVYCSFDLVDKNDNSLYSSVTDPENKYANARIKLRGNTSSYPEKAPYKIKLGEKIDLLKELLPNRSAKTYKDKEWLLLTNTSFKTLVGYSVNSYLSGDNQLNGQFVNVYINGDYRGMYFLSESIKQGSGSGAKQSRVAIDDDGYIIEDDAYWWNEDVYFETPLIHSLTAYTFKYPDSDDITSDQIDYIKNYVNGFEDALLKNDESYQDYIDLNSFAAWILTHDVLGTYDSGGSNIYMTKKDSADSKLKMGPCWDFDSILGMEIESYCRARSDSHLYYKDLFNKNSFVDAYNNLFTSKKDGIITALENTLALYSYEALDANSISSQIRWNTDGSSSSQETSIIIDYLNAKINWLNSKM